VALRTHRFPARVPRGADERRAGTSADRRTALAHFVLQMSPHDAALLQQALDQARGQAEEAG